MNVTYPSAGPRKAVEHITAPLLPMVAFVNKSAADPAATANGGLPNKPAINLRATKPPKLFVNPHPITNAAYNGVQVK